VCQKGTTHVLIRTSCGPSLPRASDRFRPGATREQVLAAMKGHVLAEAHLMGRYQR